MARLVVDMKAKRIAHKKACLTYEDSGRRERIKGAYVKSGQGVEAGVAEAHDVVAMDELRASKFCSQCRQTLSTVNYKIDTKLLKRVVLTHNRAETHFDEKLCDGVLQCNHAECTAKYWDRDVNAAINMVNLLKSEVLGLGRMESFRW